MNMRVIIKYYLAFMIGIKTKKRIKKGENLLNQILAMTLAQMITG